jgi:hypothetical protein
MRAMVLISMINHLVRQHMVPREDKSWRDLDYALEELFVKEGVEVLTDLSRQDLGLPPRGPDGWTVEEIIACEQRMLEAMLRPVPPVIVEKAG